MAGPDQAVWASLLDRYGDDLESIAEPLALRDDRKAREKLTDFVAKLVREDGAAGLAAVGFGAATGPLGGIAAGLAVKVVMARFENWLEENSATGNLRRAAANTQSEADRRLLVRDIGRWLAPTLANLGRELKQLPQQPAYVREGDDALFKAVMARLPDPQADSLAGLLRARTLSLPAKPALPSPAQLVDARYEVVPFDEASRQAELAALHSLCADETLDRFELRLFVGPGGAGKTRLLMHFCQSLWSRTDEHWHAGFLHEDMQERALQELVRAGAPALVVIDYAEGRRDLSRWLKQLLEADRVRSKLRIVLLARHAGDWWAGFARGDAALDHLARHPVVQLQEVVHAPGDRMRMYEAASVAYARLLTQPPLQRVPALAEPQYARPLYLHMAALFDILAPSERQAAAKLPWMIVEREGRLWDAAPATDPWPMRRWMAAITLRGGAELSELEHLAHACGCAYDEALARRFADFYPREHGVGALEPDLLGEALVLHVLNDRFTSREFVERILGDGSSRVAQQALTVLARIGAEHPEAARPWIERALEADPAGRARAAFEATLAVAEQHVDDVLGPTLARALRKVGDTNLARELEADLPEPTVSLGEVKVWIFECLRDAAETPEERARYGMNLGNAYSRVGDRERALGAIRQAVDIRRNLAALRPYVSLPYLAASLNNLGSAQIDMGDRKGALAATCEAVDTYRKLESSRPGVFLHGLATSLNNLGALLSGAGDQEGALRATQEAVDTYRELASSQPDAFLPHLASTLGNLGIRLSETGDHEGALRAALDAADAYRTLALHRPDAFLPDLARSLNNLGPMLRQVGDWEGALKATREAVDTYRRLASGRPAAFRPDFGTSLNNLGIMLSGAGDREGALKATREAVSIHRELASTRAEAFLPDLAMSLNNLGIKLNDVGDREGAVLATREAADIRRALATSNPGTFAPYLASSLNNLGAMLSNVGCEDEALRATREAVDIYRKLASARPDVFLADLAMSLTGLGNRLSGAGSREDALVATREGVNIYRQLASRRPEAFLPDLATSLNNLGAMLRNVGAQEGALEAASEAVDIRRKLVSSRPDVFLPCLATSLSNFSAMLMDAGNRAGALTASEEAVGILRALVKRWPHLHDDLDRCLQLLRLLDKQGG